MNNTNPFALTGKCILVTGASSGIGRAVAIECAKLGAQLVITARNEERLSETMSQLQGVGHKMVYADLLDASSVAVLVSCVDKLDGVVLCAGVNDKSLVKFLDESHIEKVMSTNFISPVMLIKQLVKFKKMQKESSIVFLSSISAFYPSMTNAIYGASKAAISQFAKVLAIELLPQRIRVNCINPSFVETEMLKKYSNLDELRASAPMGRFLEPNEVAFSVVYLLSDATKLITGSTIIMDGGFLLRH